MKNKLVLLITSCLALVLSSCLDTDEPEQLELVKNCQIHEFSLSSDSVPGLAAVKFTIDQLTGQIFNADSLPYGTKVKRVVCKLKTAGHYSISRIEISEEAYKDSTFVMKDLTDSVDFSAPVKFVVFAYDGATQKVYNAHVNIHQVLPDTMLWSMYANPMLGISVKDQQVIARNYNDKDHYFMYVKPADANKPYQLFYAPVTEPKDWNELAVTGLPSEGLMLRQMTEYRDGLYVPAKDGSLYHSEDGLTWAKVTNAPSVKSVLGVVKKGAKQASALATIAESEGKLSFYAMNKSGEWLVGSPVPEDFPLTGFSSIQYETMFHQYLSVAAGRTAKNQVINGTWATMNALDWSMMSENEFSEREGTMLTEYDGKFFMVGGIDASGKALKDIHESFDHGITWALIDTMLVLPAEYESRGFSSIVVDKQNFVNIFGGKTSVEGNDLNQLWRGRINRLIPKHE